MLREVKVDFVKIDVEGLELDFLKSMRRQIEKNHPTIMCEIYKGKIDSNNPYDTIKFMRDFGYKVYRVIDAELVEFGKTEKHLDHYYNYFFVYEE